MQFIFIFTVLACLLFPLPSQLLPQLDSIFSSSISLRRYLYSFFSAVIVHDSLPSTSLVSCLSFSPSSVLSFKIRFYLIVFASINTQIHSSHLVTIRLVRLDCIRISFFSLSTFACKSLQKDLKGFLSLCNRFFLARDSTVFCNNFQMKNYVMQIKRGSWLPSSPRSRREWVFQSLQIRREMSKL